jgi:hypothetical protein
MFLILRFNGAPTTNPSISCNHCPHLMYKFRFVNPRAIVFLMACPRYHTVLWVDESDYLPDEGITVLLFLSTVVTHTLYETSHLLGENINVIRADACRFLRPQPQKILPVWQSLSHIF